jgi:hypothetical protein
MIPAQPSAQFTDRQIDVSYLTALSDDAVPELIAVADASTAETRKVLEEDLRQRLAARRKDSGWRRWQSYHIARWKAYRLLTSRYGG